MALSDTNWSPLRFNELCFRLILVADRHHKSNLSRKKVGTYTPMTDCFFGGSLLMFVTGDQKDQGRRGDVMKKGK